MTDCNRDKSIARQLLCLSVIGIIPLLCILYIYASNQSQQTLIYISAIADNPPIFFSENDPLLSVVMSFYVKLSPLYGAFFFAISYKKLKVDTSFSRERLISTLFLFSLFYLFSVYFLLFHNVNMNTSGLLLRFLARDCYRLTFLFALIFICCHVLTYCYVSFIYGCLMVFKRHFLK